MTLKKELKQLTKKDLKKAFILKEILDRPVALRNEGKVERKTLSTSDLSQYPTQNLR
jgi:hypothetical protein